MAEAIDNLADHPAALSTFSNFLKDLENKREAMCLKAEEFADVLISKYGEIRIKFEEEEESSLFFPMPSDRLEIWEKMTDEEKAQFLFLACFSD